MRMFVEPDDIYLHLEHVDFRKSINGLLAIIESELIKRVLRRIIYLLQQKTRQAQALILG